MVTALDSPRLMAARNDRLGAEDFETASIRSAAPSYISDAPSYHSTVPVNEPIPAYSPPAPPYTRNGAQAASSSTTNAPVSLLLLAGAPDRADNVTPQPRTHRSAPPPPPASSAATSSFTANLTSGLPPIPPVSRSEPSLDAFRIPTWSTISSNPTYHNVAMRRLNKNVNPVESLRRMMMLEGVLEEDESRHATHQTATTSHTGQSAGSAAFGSAGNVARPLEDPYLVGEEAAARARNLRLARENREDVLVREDRRWDVLLAQMRTWEVRERAAGTARVRREVEPVVSQRKNLVRRIGGRLLF